MIIPTTRAEPSIEACSISGGLFRPLRLFQFHELRFRSTEQHADGVIEPGSFRFAGDIPSYYQGLPLWSYCSSEVSIPF